WRLELAVLARGNADRARLAAFRAEASQRFPDADWWQGSDRTANPSRASTMRLTAGTELDSLSNGAPDWKRFFVQVDRRREQGNLHAGISSEQRFGLSDLTLSAGADWQWDTRWSAGVDLGFGLDAAFGPRNAFSGWALRSWSQGWETEFRMA